MARLPRTGRVVATAHQGVRPMRRLRHLLRRAVALSGGLLLRPLGVLWRALPYPRSRKAKSSRAAAAMARRDWRDDTPTRAASLLRLQRAVARARGAVDAAFLSGRRALAVLHRAFTALHRMPSPRRALVVVRAWVRAWVRRVLRARRPFQGQGAPPPPPPPRTAGAWMYGRLERPSPPPAISPPPPPPPPPPPTHTVAGEVVPQHVVNLYRLYCTLECPAKHTVCHFCVFEWQRTLRCTVPTWEMIAHCDKSHVHTEQHVRCNEDQGRCPVRTRPGLDQARHIYFCHRRPPGWWIE